MVLAANLRFLVFCALLTVPLLGSESPTWTFWCDNLTSKAPPAVAAARTNKGGEFEAGGWRVVGNQSYLRIALPVAARAEGFLELRVTGFDPARLAEEIGCNRKVHFLNLFSNRLGEHHFEDGGTARDALWTLRVGTGADGGSRYGSGFKLLWSSRGAKRAPGSAYDEREVTMPDDWRWAGGRTYLFSIHWSGPARQLWVKVDGMTVAVVPWRQKGESLRYVFLGGTPDFHSMTGALYSDLRVGWRNE